MKITLLKKTWDSETFNLPNDTAVLIAPDGYKEFFTLDFMDDVPDAILGKIMKDFIASYRERQK